MTVTGSRWEKPASYAEGRESIAALNCEEGVVGSKDSVGEAEQ